jgi:aldehyde:ferredoxin oxidoreductase
VSQPGGYAGRFLNVDLSTGELKDEAPDIRLLRDYIGGYGVAARLLFERQRAGVDPLGPENTLAILTGPLTGTPAPTGTRWVVAAKSPLTQTWGDANGSGSFGPTLKFAGYDGVFFTGIARSPVYLCIENGKPELCDAGHLWGQDTYEIENWIKAEFGKSAEGICIGPAGEKLSLISAIITQKGRAAGRSGLGAVMGSKRLKAVVVKGEQPIPLADAEAVKTLGRKYNRQITEGTGFSNFYRDTGTPGYIEVGVKVADSPTRNWGGVGPRDYVPDVEKIGFDAIMRLGKKRRACWKCPIACWGEVETDYAGRQVSAHVPEYETASAFGSNLLNDDLPSIVTANELCNRLGLDTISAGATIAFAIECYQNGLLTEANTNGMALTWGDSTTIINVLEKLATREPGLGELLADGVKVAAEKIGPESKQFAIHAGGQELPMHDPRYEPALGVIYQIDATPGRHTQGCQYLWPEGMEIDAPGFGVDRDAQVGRGKALKPVACLAHVMQASGICLFGYLSTRVEFLPELLTAVTGHYYTLADLLIVGERIANIRQAYNVREGYNPIAAPVSDRAYGIPPLGAGPTAGFTVDLQAMRVEYLDEMGWTHDAAAPTRDKLVELGMEDVAEILW